MTAKSEPVGTESLELHNVFLLRNSKIEVRIVLSLSLTLVLNNISVSGIAKYEFGT